MIHFFKAWITTIAVFFIGDFIWLHFIMNKFFVPRIKHLMNTSNNGTEINYFSAMIVYFLISIALSWFVVVPMAEESLMKIYIQGAFLGLCMYGVYEFTNHATLNNWPITFLVVDVLWGTLWSGMVSVISVVLLC